MIRILVADDEPWVRELLREILSEEYQVDCAEDGQDAWVHIEANEYAVILLDLRMPRMTGSRSCSDSAKRTRVQSAL